MTGIDPADLERPPVVHAGDGARRGADGAGRGAPAGPSSSTTSDNLHGWLSAERAAGAGTVGSAGRRMEAWVPVDASLKTAFR